MTKKFRVATCVEVNAENAESAAQEAYHQLFELFEDKQYLVLSVNDGESGEWEDFQIDGN